MQRSRDIMHIHVCAVTVYVYVYYTYNTVDGRNPAPPGIYKTLYITGLTTNLNWLAGFLPSTVCTCLLVASTTLPFLETSETPNLDCSENTPWVLAVSPAAGVPLHQRGSPHITTVQQNLKYSTLFPAAFWEIEDNLWPIIPNTYKLPPKKVACSFLKGLEARIYSSKVYLTKIGWYLDGTVDGRNLANQLRSVVYPIIYLQGFIYPRWCRVSCIRTI